MVILFFYWIPPNEAQETMLLLSSLCAQQNGVIAEFGNVGMLPAVRPTLAPVSSRSPLLAHPHLFQLPSHNERPCDVRGKSSTSLAQPLSSLPPLYTGFFSGHSTPWKMGDPVAHPTLPSQGATNRGGKPFRSFSESLITWYISTLHLSVWTENLVTEGPHLNAAWATVFPPASSV